MGKFKPGQEIWWWDEDHLELHKGRLTGWYGNWIHDCRCQIETTDDCDSEITVPFLDVYATLEDARLRHTKILYDKAKAAVAETKKFDEAHLKLLRL